MAHDKGMEELVRDQPTQSELEEHLGRASSPSENPLDQPASVQKQPRRFYLFLGVLAFLGFVSMLGQNSMNLGAWLSLGILCGIGSIYVRRNSV